MARPRNARVVVKSATADLIREWIDEVDGKTQEEIAYQTGFERPNVVTMIKQGRTRMPMDKIEAFAKAVGKAPDKLFRTAIMEYEPGLARLITKMERLPMIEGLDALQEIMVNALTEVLQEAKKDHLEGAEGVDRVQALRMSARLKTDRVAREKLKNYVKQHMVEVIEGDDPVSRFGKGKGEESKED